MGLATLASFHAERLVLFVSGQQPRNAHGAAKDRRAVGSV